MSRLVGVVALLVGVLSACTEPPLPDSERDEAGVYAAVLRHVARRAQRWPDGRWRYLLVADHSAWDADPVAEGAESPTMLPVGEPLDWITSGLFTLRRDGYEDFARQRRAPRRLPELEIDYPLRWQPLLPRPERREFLWDGFHAEHRGATWLTSLSPIGFDASGTQAMLSVTHGSGPLAGWSDYVLLERGPRGWRVVAVLNYQQA